MAIELTHELFSESRTRANREKEEMANQVENPQWFPDDEPTPGGLCQVEFGSVFADGKRVDMVDILVGTRKYKYIYIYRYLDIVVCTCVYIYVCIKLFKKRPEINIFG